MATLGGCALSCVLRFDLGPEGSVRGDQLALSLGFGVAGVDVTFSGPLTVAPAAGTPLLLHQGGFRALCIAGRQRTSLRRLLVVRVQLCRHGGVYVHLFSWLMLSLYVFCFCFLNFVGHKMWNSLELSCLQLGFALGLQLLWSLVLLRH